jgi:hypothetical protein
MTDHQDHDTKQAPTTAADNETTELPPGKAAEMAHAWSLDDTTELDSEPPRRWLSIGLIGLVIVMAGALTLLAVTLFRPHGPKPVEPKAQPTTTVPVAARPPPAVTVTTTPPPTVTVTAQPPAPPPLSATDQQFLSALRTYGLTYPDPDYAISNAHGTCEYMTTHGVFTGSEPTAEYIARTTIWPNNGPAAIFAYQSATAYCPQRLSD